MAKASMDYSGLDNLTRRISELGGNVEEAGRQALVKTHEHVTANIERAMESHKVNGKPVNWDHTGATKESLRKEAVVQFAGSVGSVKTGFEWPTAAKYLAYGRGTPRELKVSPGLKNAIDSTKLRKEILAIQEQALAEYVASIM